MKRTKAQRLLAAACGPALGVLFAVPVSGLLAGSAGAATGNTGNSGSCYTGCTTPTVPIVSTTGANTVAPVNDGTTAAATTSSTPTSSGLAFTGADIEEMAVIGVVAIGVGTVLVRGRRRTA
jgi:hypothetical protein